MLQRLLKLTSLRFSQISLKAPPKTIVKVDVTRSPQNQPVPLHNRWHPEIPPVGTVAQGEVFRLECLDCTGGQIKNDDSVKDIETCDVGQVHYLSGPVYVDGAEPGDLL
jgi:formamidase